MNQPASFLTARILAGLALVATVIVWSCDSYDPDVVPKDEISVGKTQFYALPNSSTVIDLKTLVTSYSRVDLLIGKQPQQGSLTKLGAGVYAYMPQVDLNSGRDYFMLDVRRDGQTVQLDTIYIEIGQDTTQLPCGVYAVMDVISVPNTAAGQVIPINVLANDHICGADTSDLVVSIYTNPQHGTASSDGRTVSYTTSGYVGKDVFRYAITSQADTAIHAFGLVRITTGEASCLEVRRDDVFVNIDTLQSNTILVNVIVNDDICNPSTDIPTIVTQPNHGTAAFINYGTLAYTLPSLPTAAFTDSLTYKICHGSLCNTAQVVFTFAYDTCKVIARPDSVNVSSGAQGFGIDIDVLENDSICSNVQAVTILTAPKKGTATVQPLLNNAIRYVPDNSAYSPVDSLQYQVCGGSGGCAKAWVKVKSF